MVLGLGTGTESTAGPTLRPRGWSVPSCHWHTRYVQVRASSSQRDASGGIEM
jgi:hypothetical protein